MSRFGKGDTVSIEATVKYASPNPITTKDFNRANCYDLEVESPFSALKHKLAVAEDQLTLVKKAPVPAPPAGTVIDYRSMFGYHTVNGQNVFRYIMQADGSLKVINRDQSVVKTSSKWAELDQARVVIR